LKAINSLDIVPVKKSDIEARVNSFSGLDDSITLNFADILLGTMTCLYKLYMNSKESGMLHGNEQTKALLLSQYREQAKAIVIFSGQIHYRMPGETNSNLIRMEVFMN